MKMADAIDLSLSAGSIDRAISALNSRYREVRSKADDICERTAQFAEGLAAAYYEGYAGPEIQGGPPRVWKEKYSDGHGYHVYASGSPMYPEGNTVMFYEFGSGTAAGADNPIAAKVGARPGSWSSTYGTGEFAANKQWHHGEDENGEPIIYTAIDGTNAMYRTGQDARERMKQLMQREFK